MNKADEIENWNTYIIPAIIIDERKKLNVVNMNERENSCINDFKFMLNAPSNSKKSSVNVVKIGAAVANWSGCK